MVVSTGSPRAAAQVNLQYVSEKWTIEIHNNPDWVCERETAAADVIVNRFGVFWDGQQFVYFPRPTHGSGGMATIAVSSSNSAAYDPAPVNLPSGLSSVHKVTGAAMQKGTADVTVEALLASGDVAATNSFTLEVKQCDYALHTFSIWHITAGWNIVAGSSVDTVLKRVPSAGQRWETQGALAENDAVSFPIGGCRATYTTSQSDVSAEAIRLGDQLSIDMSFGVVQAGTEVCHVLGVVGGNDGAGQPQPISFEVPTSGGNDGGDHELFIDGLGTFTGPVFATVVKVPT